MRKQLQSSFCLDREGIILADSIVPIFFSSSLVHFDAYNTRYSHMFSTHQFNSHVRIVIHQELSRIDSLLEAVARSPQGQNTVNLPELFFRYTLSSFSKMAFSADLDCLSADPKCLERPVPFAVAFDFAQVRSISSCSSAFRPSSAIQYFPHCVSHSLYSSMGSGCHQ